MPREPPVEFFVDVIVELFANLHRGDDLPPVDLFLKVLSQADVPISRVASVTRVEVDEEGAVQNILLKEVRLVTHRLSSSRMAGTCLRFPPSRTPISRSLMSPRAWASSTSVV